MVGIMNVVGYPLGWKLVVEEGSSSEGRMPAFNLGRAGQLHQRLLCAYQCTSTLVKHIDAPVELVWSFVRRFDEPQKYKPFVNQCVVWGGLVIGSVREISLKSGLPATRTTEVLERLDDIERALGIRTIGGDHILTNYSSLVTVHPNRLDGRPGTTVIESFVVDVPEDKTEDDICYFVEAVIKTNLNSLAELSERLARQRQ